MYDPLDNPRYRLLLLSIFWYMLFIALACFGWAELTIGQKWYQIGMAIFGHAVLGLLVYGAEPMYQAAEKWLADGYRQQQTRQVEEQLGYTGDTIYLSEAYAEVTAYYIRHLEREGYKVTLSEPTYTEDEQLPIEEDLGQDQ